jgi:hypothetical protein
LPIDEESRQAVLILEFLNTHLLFDLVEEKVYSLGYMATEKENLYFGALGKLLLQK